MPEPIDIYARLSFKQGTVAADARAAMEAARKEFAQGINVPLRFQQQGGGGGGTAGGGGGGGIGGAPSTASQLNAARQQMYREMQAQHEKASLMAGIAPVQVAPNLPVSEAYKTAARQQMYEEMQAQHDKASLMAGQKPVQIAPTTTAGTAAAVTQAATTAATTAATKAATTAARATGGGAAAPAANAVGGIAPAATQATQSLAQMVQGIRTVTRVAAIAEGVASLGELGIHGGRLIQARAEGKNLTAAAEVSVMQDIVKSVPFVGAIADKLGNTVYDLISATKNYAGGGKFESDQEYAQRLTQEQKFQDKISQMRAQRARAFLPGPQAAVAAAEETRTEFTSSKEAQLLREQNPDLYKRVYEEIGRTINVVKKKAAVEDEHDTFQHEQTLTRINDQAEIARMNASGNRLGAERKQVSERYDYEIATAEQAAKELREVNRDKEAEEQDQRAAALRGLKGAELEEVNARNRMIGFTSGTALWQRMMEAAARYTATIKDAGKASEDTGKQIAAAGSTGAMGLDKAASAAEKVKKAIADIAPDLSAALAAAGDINPGGGPPVPFSFQPEQPQVTAPGGGVVGGMDLGGDTATSVNMGSTAEQNLNTIIGRQGTDISPEAMNSESGLLVAAKRMDQLAADAMRSKNYKAATTFRLQAATLRNKLRIMRTRRTGKVPGETRRGSLLGDIAPGLNIMMPSLGKIPVYGPGDRYNPADEADQAAARDAYQQSEIQEMPAAFRAKKMAELKQSESTSKYDSVPTPEERAASGQEATESGRRGAAMGGSYFQPPTTITPENVHSFGKNINLADGSFDKFKRAMKEAMRETGAQFELIK